jgi:hypothetical protein
VVNTLRFGEKVREGEGGLGGVRLGLLVAELIKLRYSLPKILTALLDLIFLNKDMFNLDWLLGKKSKLSKTGLEEAKEKGLITEEEFLRLKEHRASEELDKFLKSRKSKK